MAFQYSCDDTPQSDIWLYEYTLDTTNVLTVPFYAVKCYNTTTNAYYGMIFVNGQQTQTVNAEYKRILWYNTDQTIAYNTTGSYISDYDVTYFNGDAMTDNPNGIFQDNQTGTSQELNSAAFIYQMAQNAYEYFNTPTTPYMDVTTYTTGTTRNTAIVTVQWDNIQNIPSGMYPASYQVKIGAYVAAGHVNNIAYCPYNDKEFKIAYNDILATMTETEQDDAIINGRVWLVVELGHNDGERWVTDAEYKFRVEDTGDITDETDPGTGGDIIIHNHMPAGHDDEYNDDDGGHDPQAPGQAMSVDNLLYTSYALTENAIQLFGQYIWTNNLPQSLYENQVAPIENILACKRIPFAVGGTDTSIKIGNVDTRIGVDVLAGHVQKTNASHIENIGTIHVPTYNGGNWFNYTNKYSIYLPYCGIHELPTDALLKQSKQNGIPYVVGKDITIKYYYDIIYGTCAAELSIDGVAMFIFNGDCGIDIPITSSNRAANQLAMRTTGENTLVSGVSSVLGGAIGGALSGGLIGGAVGALKGAFSTATQVAHNEVTRQNQEIHYRTSGGFSSQLASYLPSTVTLFCEHVLYTEPTGYAKENGYPCYLNRNMSELTGYTELDGSIEISDIPCLEEERVLLKQALMDGFYL